MPKMTGYGMPFGQKPQTPQKGQKMQKKPKMPRPGKPKLGRKK